MLSAARARIRGIVFSRIRSLTALYDGLRRAIRVLAVLARTLLRASLRSRAGHTRLRIGVDIRPFYEPLTGVGWYLYHLLEELSQRDDLELLCYGDPLLAADTPRMHVSLPGGDQRAFDMRGFAPPSYTRRLTTAVFPLLILADRCDVLFGGNYFLPRAMSSVARRRVVTVHDLAFRRMPEVLQAETLANLDREMTREIFRADAVICVSAATRHDLLAFYQADARRIHVIHSGIAPQPDRALPVPGLPARYVLFVSTIEPRKNLDVLIGAFEIIRARGSWDGELVVVGKIGWKSEATVRRMRESRWATAIHHLDYLSREQLATVYRSAEMLVLPSLYEGFGFPLIEAMSYGVPAIAARTSSLPEVGGDAALYFDARSPDDLAAAIERVAGDAELRRDLQERGRARAASFSWRDAAGRTAAVFRRAAEDR